MDKKPLVLAHAEPFLFKGNEIGCLLLHGYTGTPFEMRMLGISLSQEGFTVLAPRLNGHGTVPEDLMRTRWWDWLADVEDALTLLKSCTERQIVLGLSMGGVLSLLTAARYPVEAVVSFSTPSDMPHDLRVKLLPFFCHLAPYQNKDHVNRHDPQTFKGRMDYPYYPTRSLIELRHLIDTMRTDLPTVKVPILFAQSHNDKTIPPASMDYLYDHVSSINKSRMWLETSGHVIVREAEREKLFAATKQFIRKVLDL